MSRVLMKGNEAIAKAAIISGCRYFFGYPITPQNEIPEYMAREMHKVGGVFLQSESEIAAVNMVYGASGSGGIVMTSSSSPGIALKQEGISYIASAELPCVIVNMMRSGPGLGGIQPSQADYFQVTRGGGNGDYRVISYAPASVQESVELVNRAFRVSEKYRIPASEIGESLGSSQLANMVLLGAYLSVAHPISLQSVVSAMEDVFHDCDASVLELNVDALKKGFEYVKRP